MNPRIIFIHGMFLTAKCWEHWQSYFRELGYETAAIPWPLHDEEAAVLRNKIPPALGKLSLADLHAHYAAILRTEPTPPIVIGHSLGGLLVQKLAADGLIRIGVGICSVAPNRMLALDWGFLKNSVSITNPFAGDDPFEMTAAGFYQNFGNAMTEEESNAAYHRYAVHESRQVLRDILGDEGKIDLELPHVPLLFIGAEEDAIMPASLVRRNAHAYKDERSFTEYAEFSGRGHFITGENGWEEVAEKTANWLQAHLNSERA